MRAMKFPCHAYNVCAKLGKNVFSLIYNISFRGLKVSLISITGLLPPTRIYLSESFYFMLLTPELQILHSLSDPSQGFPP